MPLSFPELALLWIAAVATAVVTAYLAKRTAEAKGLMGYGYNFFLLTVLVGMPAAALGYLYQPGYIGAFWAVWINMAFMTIGLVPLMYGFMLGLTDYSGRSKYESMKLGSKAVYRWSAITLILANEFMMGWVFVLLTGERVQLTSVSMLTLLEEFGKIISSYWFVFTMAIEMFVSIYLFRRNFRPLALEVLILQSIIMALTPTAIESKVWAHASILAGTVAMTVLFIVIYDELHKSASLNPKLKRYISYLFVIYAVMMFGLYMWESIGDTILLSLAIIAEMSLYFGVIIRQESFSGDEVYKPYSSLWVTTLTFAVYFSQVFMGGLLVLDSIAIPGRAAGELLMNFDVYNLVFSAVVAILLAGGALLVNLKLSSFRLSSGFDNPRISKGFFAALLIAFGVALFPSVVIYLDELADSNPSFHMLQHFAIGIAGILIGLGLRRLSLIKSGILSRLYSMYLLRSRDGLYGIVAGTLLLAFWFFPTPFLMAYQSDTIHGLEHFSILAAGILSGICVLSISSRLRFLLIFTFSWMAAMMLPFFLIMGPFRYEPSYFVNTMSEGMYVWIASILVSITVSIRAAQKEGESKILLPEEEKKA